MTDAVVSLSTFRLTRILQLTHSSNFRIKLAFLFLNLSKDSFFFSYPSELRHILVILLLFFLIYVTFYGLETSSNQSDAF